jgi:hypothetical protein
MIGTQRMKSKIISLISMLFTLTTLNGCSAPAHTSAASHERPAKTSSKLDACLLLTKSDAEELMGEAASSPTSSHVGETVSRCGYMSQSGSKRVSLLVRQASSHNEAVQIFQKAQNKSKGLSGSDPQAVPGLGDAAFWAGGTLKQLNVLKGDAWLIVSAHFGSDNDPLAAGESAAKKILAHLE